MNRRLPLLLSFVVCALMHAQAPGLSPNELDTTMTALLDTFRTEQGEEIPTDTLIAIIDKNPAVLEQQKFIQTLCTALKKKPYKNLLRACLKHPWTLLDKSFSGADGQELAQLSDALKKEWEELVSEACQVLAKHNVPALHSMISQWSRLLTPPQGMETTVLHKAVSEFNSQDSRTVELFSYLMKAGADVTVPNKEGITVEALLKPGHKAYQAYLHHKNQKEHPSIMAKKADEVMMKAKAHWKVLLGGLIMCSCLYLVLPKKNSLHRKLGDVARTRATQLLKHEKRV